MIFAAVDIGSNAMRLLFCRAYDVNGKPHFSKEELIFFLDLENVNI